jgi:hypothetical protein
MCVRVRLQGACAVLYIVLYCHLFDADGRTDGKTEMTQPIVTFGNFSKASKNARVYFLCAHWT